MIRHNILDIFNERIYELGIKQKYIAEKMNITQDRLSRIRRLSHETGTCNFM